MSRQIEFEPLNQLAKFEYVYPMEMQLFRNFGTYPYSGIKSFYNPFTKLSMECDFGNIGIHCLAVAQVALALARKFHQLKMIEEYEYKEIGRRALLHDLLKPLDVFLAAELRTGMINLDQYYSPNVFEPAVDWLITQGISNAEAQFLVNDIGRETNVRGGVQRLIRLNTSCEVELKEGMILEKIVVLADNMTCSPEPNNYMKLKTKILPSAARFDQGMSGTRYPWAENAGVAINIQEKAIAHSNNLDLCVAPLKPFLGYHAFLVWTSDKIEEEIKILFQEQERSPNESGQAGEEIMRCIEENLCKIFE